MQTPKELRQKIQASETEHARLMGEIESLRKDAETRAATLEVEARQLREETNSLHKLLGNSTREPFSS